MIAQNQLNNQLPNEINHAFFELKILQDPMNLMISHSTIVFSPYILLSMAASREQRPKSLGCLFYELSDEVHELDWTVAIKQLLQLLDNVVHKSIRKLTKWFESQYCNGLKFS